MMNYSKELLISIIERSSNIFERLDASKFHYNNENTELIAEQRLNNWCNTSCAGDWDKFQYRLSKLGVTLDSAKTILGDVKYKTNQDFPQWAIVLEDILLHYHENASKYFNKNTNPIAFEEIFMPYLDWAEKKLITLLKKHSSILVINAYDKFKLQILEQLSQLSMKVLEFEFSAFRSLRCSPLDRLIKEEKNISTNIYNEFITKMYHGGYIELAYTYPVFARLSATLVLFYINNITEITERLSKDISEIEAVFYNGTSIGKVLSILPNKSDSHNNGRTVTILTFENKFNLIYKPKNMSIDEAYFNLLGWFNSISNISLYHEIYKNLRILSKHNYGWMEYVDYKPCYTQMDIESYYTRAGALMALVYVLNIKDCHLENIIACGDYPVIVDLECTMHPSSTEVQSEQYRIKHSQFAEDDYSICRTGLLPGQLFTMDKVTIDIAGFGTASNYDKALYKLKWININTDTMVLRQVIVDNNSKNIPSIDNEMKFPEQYTEYIKNGFNYIYELLLNNKAYLISDGSPLYKFENLVTRFILRASKVYSALISQTTEPKYMKYGIDRSIQLDTLCKYNKSLIDDAFIWQVLHEELKSLEQLDIPYINTNSDDNICIINNKQLIINFSVTGFNLILNQIQSLSIENIARQVDIINNKYLINSV